MDTPAPACPPAGRFTLRQLPLPAKVVVTLFLLTVGVGYGSALVQMHFQHTQADGTPMPTPADVVEIFAGKKWLSKADADKDRPKSKLEKLVNAAVTAPFNGAGGMAAAFYHKDPDYKKQTADPARKPAVDAQRAGEQRVVTLWANAPEADRRAAYEADRFAPTADAPAAVTPDFADGGAFKVRSILNTRCASCHAAGGEVSGFPLETYDQFEKYLAVAAGVEVPAGGGWVPSDRQISQTKLAQSTHAHLLSFAMLFALTGLTFAFTGYPGWVRLLVAPLVLLAQVADVSCWWLARLPVEQGGPYFAYAIIGTGGLVGSGLAVQIVLGVFGMYGVKGKAVLAGLFLLAGAGGGR